MTIEMTSHCPACGAEMTVMSQTTQITCSFCGNRYSVDTTTSQPGLELLATPGDITESAPDAPLVPNRVPETPPIAAGANTFDLPSASFTPPGAPVTSSRRPIGLIIAIVFATLLCLVFGCMAIGSYLMNGWNI